MLIIDVHIKYYSTNYNNLDLDLQLKPTSWLLCDCDCVSLIIIIYIQSLNNIQHHIYTCTCQFTIVLNNNKLRKINFFHHVLLLTTTNCKRQTFFCHLLLTDSRYFVYWCYIASPNLIIVSQTQVLSSSNLLNLMAPVAVVISPDPSPPPSCSISLF